MNPPASPLRIAALCAPLLLASTPAASAPKIEVRRIDCSAGVHLVARQAPLHDVLRRLSKELEFQLQLDGSAATLIDTDVTRPPVQLVSSLSPQDSIIVTQARDPRCPGRNRVVKVWVLSAKHSVASEAAPKPATAAPAATPPKAPAKFVTEHVIRNTAEVEEQSRRAKEAYDEYVRTHGKPPPGIEQEEAAR